MEVRKVRDSKVKKKEMKQKYLEMKFPMGAFIIRNKVNGKVFVNVSHDIKSTFNSYKFQLRMGSLRVRELQKEWKKYGEEVFEFKVLEYLEHDKKEDKKDYSEELEIMKIVWLEKLSEATFYMK